MDLFAVELVLLHGTNIFLLILAIIIGYNLPNSDRPEFPMIFLIVTLCLIEVLSFWCHVSIVLRLIVLVFLLFFDFCANALIFEYIKKAFPKVPKYPRLFAKRFIILVGVLLCGCALSIVVNPCPVYKCSSSIS